MTEDLTIGIDIGGTKMAFVIADRQGNIREAKTVPTRSGNGVADTFQRITSEINEFISRYDRVCGIGVGVPGPVDAKRGIALQAANLGWEHVPVSDAISGELSRSIPIYVENDVNVGAIGEQLFGITKGVANYLYLTVGTGLGGAAMLNNRLLRGASCSEMEIGHVSLDPVQGRVCTCGQRGCVEMSISGKGLVANATAHLAEFPESGLALNAITTHEIIRLAEENDPLATSVMDEAATALGVACAWCVNLFNPELIVLGGGLIHACYHLLEERTRSVMMARCLGINYRTVTIKRSKLADAALGASALVWYHQGMELQR